jgi:hypothetical protein
MKTKSIIVAVAVMSVGFATSLSASPASKQVGTQKSAKHEAACPMGSSVGQGHLKTGPKSK